MFQVLIREAVAARVRKPNSGPVASCPRIEEDVLVPISIIIPAHNEAQVIGRLLSNLLEGAGSDELEVIIVCNGCSDDTAERARRFGNRVRVIETPTPGKSHALNLGEGAARFFPRFYVDADVVLTLDVVREVVRVMEQSGVLAAAPVMRFDLTARNWFVRAYYEVWARMPYIQEGLVAGAYALTEAGRSRFDRFPDLTADDAFVRLHFRPHERATVHSCSFVVVPPATLWTLIRIKTRSHFGNRQLQAVRPELIPNRGRSHFGALMRMGLRPANWPRLAVYGFVKCVAWGRGAWRHRFGDHAAWDRDESSRVGPVTT